MYCALYVAVLLPFLAILAYLAAGQSCFWLLANLVTNIAAINLAVMLINLDVLSINLAVLCCIDLDVLCIRSGSAAAVAGLSCSSSCWSVLFLAAHQSCCQSCCCRRCSPFLLVSFVREKLSNIALLPLLRVVVVAHYPCLGCCCYGVACDIVAAGQSCEWWTTSDDAALI
jgi:hypothetical protein